MRLKLRFEFGPGFQLGPGKAELLEQIAAQGSIAAAGRAMGMSYKRAWSLVAEMNAACIDSVVRPLRGGSGHGGAVLTETGRRLVTEFRALEALLAQGEAQGHLRQIQALLKPGLETPDPR